MSINSVLFNVLLNQYSKNPEAVLASLPKQEADDIRAVSVPASANKINQVLISPTDFILNIHYSWFFPILEKLPPKLYPFILSTLPEVLAKGLMKMIGKTFKICELPSQIKFFFNNYICHQIKPKQITPKTAVPTSDLNILLKLSKQELVALIDFLGIHDLAIELKQTIDKKVLEKVSTLLNKEKLQYLKFRMKQKDKITTTLPGIQKWISSKKTIENLLQQRGIIRFSLALCKADHNLCWFIAHKLDTGRGNKILAILAEQKPEISNLFELQVLELAKSLKK